MSSRRVTVILNTAAGRAKDDALSERLVTVFEKNGIRVNIHRVEGGQGIESLVAEAVRARDYAVAAGGGDGTIGTVAAGLVGSETALGVLPLGTLNHFAKDLKVPLDPDEAARTIATGRIRMVDLGEVNGRIFVNNSSLGLYPSVVRGRDREQRLGRSKWVAFFWAALAVLKRYPTLTIRMACDDGQTVTRRTPLVFIGNNRYEMSGLKIGSRPRLEAGMLSIYLLHHQRAVSLLRMGLEAVFGRLRRGVGFDYVSAHTVRIDVRRRKVHVATDGEVSTAIPPLHYRIHPRALRVIVPAPEEPAPAR